MTGLIEGLSSIVGAAGVLSRPEELLVYECDGLTLHSAKPTAVVFPTSTEDVVRIVATCRRFYTPFVARGAGTGLSGGAIANEGAADPEPQPGRSRVIPLARVTGTLESPRVEITDEAVLRFAALYATERHREKLEREIDERLGEGAGSQVIDVLDGILRGEPRESSR